MKNLRTATLSGYRNGEFLQFMNNVLSVYKSVDTKALMLEERVTELSQSVNDLDEVFMNATGHELTAEVRLLDDQRIKTMRGIKFLLQSFIYRDNEDNARNANLLFNNYTTHCERIDKVSFQQKTAVLRALLKDWTTEPPLVEAITRLELNAMVEELNQQNNAFDDLYFTRARTSVKVVQTQAKKDRIRTAYDELTKDTVSFARVSSDKKPYLDIIDQLNSVIETNNIPVILRNGKKKKESDIIENNDTVFSE